MSTPARPDVSTTFGALLIGTFFLAAYASLYASTNQLLAHIFFYRLYGLTTHQTYRYFRLYPYDRLGFKLFVCLLLDWQSRLLVNSSNLGWDTLVRRCTSRWFNPDFLTLNVGFSIQHMPHFACIIGIYGYLWFFFASNLKRAAIFTSLLITLTHLSCKGRHCMFWFH